MKKIIAFILLLGLVMSFAACTAKEVTLQAMYDATIIGNLIENHGSVYVQRSEDGDVYEEQYYSDEYYYLSDTYNPEYNYASFATDHSCYMYYAGTYMRIVVLTPDGLADMKKSFEEDLEMNISSTNMLNDIVKSVTKKGNKIIVVTVSDQEELDTYKAEGWTINEEEITIDAKTLEMISAKSSYTNDESGETYGVGTNVTYGSDIPESMKMFVEYDEQTENLRTVTVVSNPGTENEKTEIIQTPKGVIVEFSYFSDDYEDTPYTLYTDAACTQTFEGELDTSADLTIYVKWDK